MTPFGPLTLTTDGTTTGAASLSAPGALKIVGGQSVGQPRFMLRGALWVYTTAPSSDLAYTVDGSDDYGTSWITIIGATTAANTAQVVSLILPYTALRVTVATLSGGTLSARLSGIDMRGSGAVG